MTGVDNNHMTSFAYGIDIKNIPMTIVGIVNIKEPTVFLCRDL